MVKNSVALAFSLAGAVAGVRFRSSLSDTADALYIFVAIGVGLAAGIGELGVGGGEQEKEKGSSCREHWPGYRRPGC